MTGTGRKAARSRARSTTDVAEDRSDVRDAKPIQRLRKDRDRNNSFIRIVDVNLKLLLGFGVLSFAIALFFIHHLVNPAEDAQLLPRVITPFPAPKIMDLPMFQGEHKESLYWGTYRPQVYLGIRARVPESLLAGLMWLGVKDGRYYMRHVCQDSDELSKYGWTHHNGRDYGHQVLIDHDMTLTSSFLKSQGAGSGYGGDWAVRVDVQTEKSRLDEEMLESAHLFFYVADEGGNALSLSKSVTDIRESSVLAFGSRADVGGWELHLKSMEYLSRTEGVTFEGYDCLLGSPILMITFLACGWDTYFVVLRVTRTLQFPHHNCVNDADLGMASVSDSSSCRRSKLDSFACH